MATTNPSPFDEWGNPITEPAEPTLTKKPTARYWDLLMGFNLVLLALLFGSQVIFSILIALGFEFDLDASVSVAGLAGNSVMLIVLMGAIPILWAMGRYKEGKKAIAPELGFGPFVPAIARGIGFWLMGYGFVIGLALLLQLIVGTEEAPVNDAIGDAVRAAPWLILLVSISAGFGEEVLFRGFLQKRIGLIGQALLFGISHAGYGTIVQVVIPFALGLFYGYLQKRYQNLWIPIIAHTLFDVASLSLAAFVA